MTPEDIERIRRSVVMVQGFSAGPLMKQVAPDLIQEVTRLAERHREAIAELRTLLARLEDVDG